MPRRRNARETGAIDRRIGANLRALRLLSGRTAADVAAALEVSVQQVGKYERGADGVGAATLFMLSRLLGVRTSHFYEGLAGPAGVAEEGAVFDRSDAPEAAAPGLLSALAAAPLSRQRRAIAAAQAALAKAAD